MAGIDENHVNQPINTHPQNPPPDLFVLDNIVQNLQPQPCAHRTHKDDFILSTLSKLSLREKLSKNKEIKDQNKVRELRNYNHHMDPAAHPEPGSETASFISIDEADVRDLKDPSIFARFLNVIPDYLLLRITREMRTDKEECKLLSTSSVVNVILSFQTFFSLPMPMFPSHCEKMAMGICII